MSTNRPRGSDARAAAVFGHTKEPSDAMVALAKARAAEQAKTARLRELRLAKEASDREAALAKSASAKSPKRAKAAP